jgi:drug/metabolite transporter (DMT)-like permease
MAFSATFAYAVVKYYGFPEKKLQPYQHFQVFLFSVLFCANIVVGNLCLSYVSVSLVQVIRSTIPGSRVFARTWLPSETASPLTLLRAAGITIGLSIVILGKKYGMNYFTSVMLVVAGVGLATYGEVETATITLVRYHLLIVPALPDCNTHTYRSHYSLCI